MSAGATDGWQTKSTNSQENTFCFGRIRPLCTGEEQRERPGQPGRAHEGETGGQGKGAGGHSRSQVAKGDVGQHVDGSQKINEETLKPRKLPDIPRDEKTTSSQIPGFDEVIIDKRRLTPVGKEDDREFQDSPKKKKKKKKKTEVDEDQNTDV